MGLEQKLAMSMQQTVVMTPQLQMAIRLLQLSHQELVDEVSAQMVENPTLDVDADDDGFRADAPTTAAPTIGPTSVAESEGSGYGPDDPSPESVAVDAHESRDPIAEIDWAKYIDSLRDQAPEVDRPVVGDDQPSFEATLTRGGSLVDHLEWQLRLTSLSEEEIGVGLSIIYNLDEHGYLRGIDLDELAAERGVSLELVEAVLRRIQQFDPLGVAARDLRECLSIQARLRFPGDEAMLLVIEHHLPNLEKKNYPQIARDLKIPLEEVYQIHRQVTELDPRPGRAYNGDEPRYITPDIYVVKVGDGYEAVLNEDGLPKLKISDYYRRALVDGNNKQTREYIQDKLRSAAWLIRSIHHRQRTILKVTNSIIKFQSDFFEKGITALRPLILKNVADDIEMHESTISRVTTNKYVHTPQGIFELKFFFNSGISRNYGEDIASESVKNEIKQIVQGEPAEHPFSDQKIVELLTAKNINIARRTVAKYREILGILPSSKRKRMF